MLAIAAFGDGSLAGVAIAVVALTPIAVHEIAAPLVPAARHVPALADVGRRASSTSSIGPTRSTSRRARRRCPQGPYGIRARGLRLRHAGAGHDAVAALDLELAAGDHAIVTGPSGAGKSTLAMALLRFLDPAGGTLELVGRDRTVALAALAGDDVRRTIGLCEQDPHVFDATIADNVHLARPRGSRRRAARRPARGAAARLGRRRSRRASRHPSASTARGCPVASGSAWRWPGRCWRTYRSLVLDEPTEHLDEPTARAFVADLAEATRDRTVLVLTHRPDLFDAPPAWRRRRRRSAPQPPRDRERSDSMG